MKAGPGYASSAIPAPTPAPYRARMEHVTFARFGDARSARDGITAIRERTHGAAEILVHLGARNAAEFEQVVQHSGESAETDLRHALVVGVGSGGITGAVLGAVLGALGVFPDFLLGAAFGVLMGVLVGLVMMSVFGSGLVDRRLQRLARGLQAGDVVVTVRCHDRATGELVREALNANGATVAEKSVA